MSKTNVHFAGQARPRWRPSAALSLLLLSALGCADKKDEPAARTREEFCAAWAKAACSAETVSACQAATAESCHLSQQRACQALVPTNFSDEHGDDCIAAVADAYADADLTGSELNTVLQLEGRCSVIVRGPKTQGETCSADRDCDESKGYRCVLRGSEGTGSCQIPELVDPGQRCEAPQQTCKSGYYCDGRNCIAVKDEGDDCAGDYECGEGSTCGSGDQCRPLLAVGATCVANQECASGLCYTIDTISTCADRIRLSPAEPHCKDLR